MHVVCAYWLCHQRAVCARVRVLRRRLGLGGVNATHKFVTKLRRSTHFGAPIATTQSRPTTAPKNTTAQDQRLLHTPWCRYPKTVAAAPLAHCRRRCRGTHKHILERSVRHTHAATIPTALLHGKRGLGLYSTCACACRGVVCLGMCVCGCYVPAVAMAVVAAVMGVAVALRLAVVDPAPCRRGQQRRQRSP